MAKKDFSETQAARNLVSMFEGTPEPDPEQPTRSERKPAKKKAATASAPEPIPTPAEGIPKGYVLKEEPKSQRLQLLLRPSIFKDLKEESARTGKSVNAICNDVLADYFREGGTATNEG